jgi:hypothetical protein
MITLEANYSKKLGLPGYSSHQYSLTVRKEVSDISQVEAESQQLYATLQANVDRDIQETGFLPGESHGNHSNGNGSRNGNGHTNGHVNGNGQSQTYGGANGDSWKCSPKQKDLILKIVDENQLDKNEIEALARERFNAPVKLLNTMQASGFISELLEKYPSKAPANGNRVNGRSYGKAAR